jgi:hypothetical protein
VRAIESIFRRGEGGALGEDIAFLDTELHERSTHDECFEVPVPTLPAGAQHAGCSSLVVCASGSFDAPPNRPPQAPVGEDACAEDHDCVGRGSDHGAHRTRMSEGFHLPRISVRQRRVDLVAPCALSTSESTNGATGQRRSPVPDQQE